MKYSELFHLNPIENVIELADADKLDKAQRLVATFVITPSLGDEIEGVALPILDPKSSVEGKGLFVVGNYGTGKSHLMSFLSIIAENAEALGWLRDPSWRAKLAPFAGQYKVRRYELNVADPSAMTLYDVVANQLTALATIEGFEFAFAPSSKVSNPKEEFSRYMEAFEAKFPNKGVLLIFDEVLDHLRRLKDDQLIRDLGVLRALGEFADGSRLKFMAGVQRSLFSSNEFHRVASEISRIRQRYCDIVIDSKGVEQLIEAYLFEKTEGQKAKIKELLLKHAPLYDVVGQDIDRFARLFPAHPRFIEEFERVAVVERREVLKVLSAEARALQDDDLSDEVPRLITSDRYWAHIERDSGLNANHEVRKLKQNVATLKERISTSMPAEDQVAATRLVEALAVNRLTTSNLSDQIGLTPTNLKDNLLWYSPIPMPDPVFLAQQAKRSLEKVREAASGQFLARAQNSDHYFIDPTLNRDFEQEVHTESRTIARHVVQRYLNEIVLRALDIRMVKPVIENRLWDYTLDWVDKNTERPGWFFFGFPNLKITAEPPKDFYIFICPSSRIDPQQETFQLAPDEACWFFDGFPSANFETKLEEAPATWLDNLFLYAAARERASRVRTGLDENIAFGNIAERLLRDLLPELNRGANDWVSVQFGKDKKTLGDWFQEVDPNNLDATFRTKLRALSQWMFSAWFAEQYRDYPVFPTKQTEETRAQSARTGQEIITGTGFGIRGTEQGRGVLQGLGLYQGDTPTYEQSRWLIEVKRRLSTLKEGQFLNASDLFEMRNGRNWFKGETIEAEWLVVVLTAGVAEGDLVIVGKGNNQYDASKMDDLFSAIRGPEDIVRITKPRSRPLEEWKRLFEVLGLPKGELAHESKLDSAVTNFVNACHDRIERLVRLQEAYKIPLPFQDDLSTESLAESTKELDRAKDVLERIKSLNSRAKMTNLSLGRTEITAFGECLAACDQLEAIQQFKTENEVVLGAVRRYQEILVNNAPPFFEHLASLVNGLNKLYQSPSSLEVLRPGIVSSLESAKVEALKAYQDLHRRHRLDADGLKRKQRLVSSDEMKRLNKLADIEKLGHSRLDAIHGELDKLIPHKGVPDEQLLRSSTSLNPDGFDPRSEASGISAIELLTRCESDISNLHEAWRISLLSLLDDPSSKSDVGALAPDDRKQIDAFLSTKKFPDVIESSFITSLNSLLKGLRTRPIKRDSFAKAIFGDGMPLRAEQLVQRVQDWVKTQTQNEDSDQVRFVLEE